MKKFIFSILVLFTTVSCGQLLTPDYWWLYRYKLKLGTRDSSVTIWFDRTVNKLKLIRNNVSPVDTSIFAYEGTLTGGWVLSGTTPAKIYQNPGIKIHIRNTAGDTTGTGLFNLYDDPFTINGLTYNFPATRFVGSVPYDSLGNGTIIWRHSPAFLDKINTWASTNTFNGLLQFGGSGSLKLPTADQTSNIGYLWRDTDSIKYTNSVGTVRTFPFGTGTTNELTYWSSTNGLGTLPTASYPNLTELSYVKGVTSGIQAQIGSKQNQLNGTGFVKASGTTITYDNSTYLTAEVDGSTTNEIEIDDLVTGTTKTWSSEKISTQLSGKQATLISGTNIKTINSNTILGSGNLSVGDATLAGTNTWTGANIFSNATATKFYYGLSVGYHTDASKGWIDFLNGDLVNPYKVRLIAGTITGSDKTITLPNTTGTVALTSDLTNMTIAPAANTDNNIPLWNGTNSKTLKDGLAYTSAATASTIVGRDASAHSAFNSITLGSASQYGQFIIYGTTYNTLITTNAATSNKWIDFPNLTGTVLLTTSSVESFPTLNQNTTGNAATVTNGVYTSRTISTTSPLSGGGDLSNNRTFSLAGLSSLGADGQLIRVNTGATAWEYFTPDYASLSADNTFTGDVSFDDAVILKETAVSDTDTDIDATDKSYIRLGYSPGSYTISTISNGIAGQILILCVTSSGNTWTVNNGTGTNNIRLNGSTNYAMGQYDTLTLIFDSGAGTWLETARSNN